jgi:hypothetical protein
MLTIDDYMHAIERAWDRAYPGREAAERDHVLRELRRLLEAREYKRARARTIRLRPVRD